MGGAAARVMTRCDELAAFSEEPDRLTRRYGTAALRQAGESVARWMREAGLAVQRDAVGNVRGRREGPPGAKTLLLGSHLDSVRDAGRYDGPLGVLTAIEAVSALSSTTLPFALEVYAFAEEEGLRFHTSYLGSRAVTGTLDAATLAMRDAEGRSVAEVCREFAGDPANLAAARRDPDDLLGYLEVHIEQGPVLERRGLPVGVVTDIIGQGKELLTFTGIAGHAGTVPMNHRADALATAAGFVSAVERIGRETDGLVATVGRLTVEPGAANVIPGRVTATLDIRHARDEIWQGAIAAACQAAREAGALRGVQVESQTVMQTPAVRCDSRLVELLASAVATTGIEPLRMVSGAGHDAVPLSRITPVAMLFVRCAGGISHNPAESVMAADVAVAFDVLTNAVRNFPVG